MDRPMPDVAYALLEELRVLKNAVVTFDEKCVRLIKPHADKMRKYAERPVGVAALYNEERGFIGRRAVGQQSDRNREERQVNSGRRISGGC